LQPLDPKALLDAIVKSFAGDERALAEVIYALVRT
jgi:hypothetical protein